MLLSARGSSAPQQRRSLPAASAASRSAAPIEQQQRSLASAARAIFFFLRAVTYLSSWPLVPPCFFWTSSRVLLLGYTPGYGGHEKGDMGVRGMGGGCQYLEECLDRYPAKKYVVLRCSKNGGSISRCDQWIGLRKLTRKPMKILGEKFTVALVCCRFFLKSSQLSQ